MTNETAPTENGVADLAAIAAVTAHDPNAAEAAAPEEPSEPAAPKPPSFDDFALHPDIKQALDDMGYFAPTAVQTAVFGPVSEGKDLMVQSRTGTGKTTAFGLPILSKLVPTHRQPQALILAPTRELALQVARELTNIGKHRGIVVEAIYGGAPIGKQITNLRNGVHVVVGTPGRVLDHIGRRTLDTKTINTFVLDECDEMLSMGFLEDIERVVSHLPEKKQTLLFSATMPDEVARYSRRHMVAPEQLSLSRDGQTVADIHHAYYIVSGIARSRDLLKVIYSEEPESAIIFCNLRDETTMVAKVLQKQGLDAEALSSDLSQSDRERVMGRMKKKDLRFLCATDVAARGIDISNLSHVINFSVPESPESYVHRTGRTGRAGKKGTAISLVGPRELGNFRFVRLTFGLKPEERLLPKDDIFIGKLKVPLPPVGVPQPPDPIQILIRGVSGTPSELETKIFEKLYQSASGKRVLAALVAEKLDKLSTKARPKRERVERPAEGAPEGAPAGEERSFDRPEGDRPRRFDRDDRGPRRDDGDRPRRFDRDDRGPRRDDGDRPRRFDRPEGGGDRPEGDRPRRFDRDDRGPRRDDGDRPRRFDRDDRGPRRDRDERPAAVEGAEATAPAAAAAAEGARPEGDRPRRDDDRPRRFDGDRPDGDRPRDRDRGDRERRPWGERGDRHRSGGDGQTMRFERRDGQLVEAPPAADVVTDAPTDAAVEARTERTERSDRPEGDRDRSRGDRDRGDRRDRFEGRDRGDRNRDRGDRDRDRGPRRDNTETIAEVRTEVRTEEAAPVAEAATPTETTKVDDVAARALERADRSGEKKPASKKKEVTSETREFWETWAEEKSTRPAAEPAAATEGTEPAAEATTTEAAEGDERPRRERGGRGRDRGGRGEKRREKSDVLDKEKTGRTKRDTTVSAPPAAAAVAVADGAQARLFISLGKKHGVSADDLRALLAGPIGGDTARIGSVSLRDSHAHVRVPEETVEPIIAALHGTQHNEHEVTVERARA